MCQYSTLSDPPDSAMNFISYKSFDSIGSVHRFIVAEFEIKTCRNKERKIDGKTCIKNIGLIQWNVEEKKSV